MRVALGGLLAGTGGAVLIAVLVLGRGGQVEALTWETVDEEGGVLWLHIESYERPPFERVFNPRREWTITDTWTRAEPRTSVEWIGAGHTVEGVLIGRGRSSEGGPVPGDTFGGEPREWPRPRGNSIGQGDGSCGEVNEGLEPIPNGHEGAFICVGPYLRPRTGTSSGAGSPAWPIDLDVVSVQKEARFNARGGLESIHFRALLEDGSRVVIGSERFHLSVLPLSAWEGIEELVWGD